MDFKMGHFFSWASAVVGAFLVQKSVCQAGAGYQVPIGAVPDVEPAVISVSPPHHGSAQEYHPQTQTFTFAYTGAPTTSCSLVSCTGAATVIVETRIHLPSCPTAGPNTGSGGGGAIGVGTGGGTGTGGTAGKQFDCARDAFIINDKNFHRYSMDTGSHTHFATVATPGGATINAIGFNVKDNYIYGAMGGNLVRIFADGTYESLMALPAGGNIGDVDDDDYYWYTTTGNGQVRQIDLNRSRSTYLTVVSASAKSIYTNIYDWAYVPAAGPYLYGVGWNTDSKETNLIRFHIRTHQFEWVTSYPQLSDVTFGPVWGCNTGNLYAIDDTHGVLYRIPLPAPGSTTVSGSPVQVHTNAPKFVNNDGARCVLNLLN